ncbi:MAG: hypothetical protein O7G84_13805, partial [Gammaproteobacteria bacterium]|nr:hypothetical protein [Gammaproteobacteria bacterium]
MPHHPAAPVEEDPGPSEDFLIAFESVKDPNDPYWRDIYTDMLKESLPLFAKDILGMEVAPHLMDWGEAVNEHSRLAILAARDHGKSAFFSYAYPIWRAWSEPGVEVYLFSRTLEQAQDLLDIVIYGKNNLQGLIDLKHLSYLFPTKDDL